MEDRGTGILSARDLHEYVTPPPPLRSELDATLLCTLARLGRKAELEWGYLGIRTRARPQVS